MDKNKCCGCTACYSICNNNAIKMIPDDEGFLYPQIDSSVCVSCYLCQSVCSFGKDQLSSGLSKNNNIDVMTYAVKNIDINTRILSRSGGFFSAVSDFFLENEGIVYGCVLDDALNAVHSRAVNTTERDRMRGTKYTQSDLGDTFNSIQKDLKTGKKVLFTGTSCQVAGLRSYLGNDYPNLYCIDVLCHGVMSPLVFNKYIDFQQKKNKEKIVAFDFRNKRNYAWERHVESIYTESGKRKDSEILNNIYLSNCSLRPSCYECPYKSTSLPGDLTMADYWGIERVLPGFSDNRGVSLIIVKNDKGESLLEFAKSKIQAVKTNIESSMQPSLSSATTIPNNRHDFWNDIHNKSFFEVTKEYGGNKLVSKVRYKLYLFKREIIKKHFRTNK